jgi:hypothetical protein
VKFGETSIKPLEEKQDKTSPVNQAKTQQYEDNQKPPKPILIIFIIKKTSHDQ